MNDKLQKIIESKLSTLKKKKKVHTTLNIMKSFLRVFLTKSKMKKKEDILFLLSIYKKNRTVKM